MGKFSAIKTALRLVVRKLREQLGSAWRPSRQSGKRGARRGPIRLMDQALYDVAPCGTDEAGPSSRLADALAVKAAGRINPPAVVHLTRLLNVMPAARGRCLHLVAVETTLLADLKGGFDSLGAETLERAVRQLEDLVPLAAGSPLDTLHLQMRRRLSELRARESAAHNARTRLGMEDFKASQPTPASRDFMIGTATIRSQGSSSDLGHETVFQDSDAYSALNDPDLQELLSALQVDAVPDGQWAVTEIHEDFQGRRRA